MEIHSSPAFRIHPSFGTGRIIKLLSEYEGELKILRTETNLRSLLKPACRNEKGCDFFHSFGSIYFDCCYSAGDLRSYRKFLLKNETNLSVIIIWAPHSLRAAE